MTAAQYSVEPFPNSNPDEQRKWIWKQAGKTYQLWIKICNMSEVGSYEFFHST